MKNIKKFLFPVVILIFSVGASPSKADAECNELVCGPLTFFKGSSYICDTDYHYFSATPGYALYHWTFYSGATPGYSFTSTSNGYYLTFAALCGYNGIEVYADCAGGGSTAPKFRTFTVCTEICNM